MNSTEKQNGEDAMAAEKSGLGPKWLKKTEKGQRIQFVLDSGSVRTIVPPEAVKGMQLQKGRGIGGGFRVANGETIPNLGEVKLEGIGEKGNAKMTAQVAAVTKPLASAYEMTENGNLVILHRTGGIVKKLSKAAEEKVRDIVKSEAGPEIVLERKAGAFKFDIEVKDERNAEEFQVPKKTWKPKKRNDMDVDEAGIEKSYYDALWEDSPGLDDEMMAGAIEDDMHCYPCNKACNHLFHRR